MLAFTVTRGPLSAATPGRGPAPATNPARGGGMAPAMPRNVPGPMLPGTNRTPLNPIVTKPQIPGTNRVPQGGQLAPAPMPGPHAPGGGWHHGWPHGHWNPGGGAWQTNNYYDSYDQPVYAITDQCAGAPFDPVLGTDGQVYSSPCSAQQAGVGIVRRMKTTLSGTGKSSARLLGGLRGALGLGTTLNWWDFGVGALLGGATAVGAVMAWKRWG